VETRGGSRRPLLSDLRESGAIEQYADRVIFVYRPEYYGFIEDEYGYPTQYRVNLIIAKNRNGFLGTVDILRNESFTTFRGIGEHENHFSFNKMRLSELDEITPQMQMLIDKFGLSDTPF
jgi:replicative DNA helicase